MPGDPIRVLLVFPNLDNALAVRSVLTELGDGEYTFYRAERPDEAEARVKRDEYSLVITELDLPDDAGPDLIQKLKQIAPATPVLAITDLDDVGAAITAIRSGAQDVLLRRTMACSNTHRTVRMAIERARIAAEMTSLGSQHSDQKDQFLSQFSHELRSPITAIYQFVTILLDGLAGELKPEQREYLEITLRNINLMREMVRDLMDVTRAQTGKLTIRPRAVSAISLIAETLMGLQTAAHARSITLAPLDMDYVAPVLADPARIRQVLNNLCDNALKFCSGGDVIKISAGVYEHDGQYVRISVADTGCGISKEGAQQVFEYLYQEHAGMHPNRRGLGIGLAICKELITQHGGQIWVDSEPGKGSTFSFILPIYPIKELLVPLLAGSDRSVQLVQLVTVELRPAPGSHAPLSEGARQRVWECMERMARSGHDVNLPRISSTQARDRYFLVVNDPDPVCIQPFKTKLLREAQLNESVAELRIYVDQIDLMNAQDIYLREAPDILEEIERMVEERAHEQRSSDSGKDYGGRG